MIHPTAIIDSRAQIGCDVSIGPYCVVGAHVTLEDQVNLVSHVSLEGRLHIGARTKIFPFASLGHVPQDLKYNQEDSCVVIGHDNVIREYVTIQKGTEKGEMETRIGNHCLLMVGVHIAHDCQVGNHVVMANQATLGGHVKIEDHVIIGGLSAVQQFVRIGEYAMIGGMSGVERDVIPYGLVIGERASLQGLNIVGLRRHGFSNQAIDALQKTYEEIFDKNTSHSVEENVWVNKLKSFSKESRRLCLPLK